MAFKLANSLQTRNIVSAPDYTWQTYRSGWSTHLINSGLNNSDLEHQTPHRFKLQNNLPDIVADPSLGELNEDFNIYSDKYTSVLIWMRNGDALTALNQADDLFQLWGLGGNELSNRSDPYFSLGLEYNSGNAPKLKFKAHNPDAPVAYRNGEHSMVPGWFSSSSDDFWNLILVTWKCGTIEGPHNGTVSIKTVRPSVVNNNAVITESTGVLDCDMNVLNGASYWGDDDGDYTCPIVIGCGDWALDDPAIDLSASGLPHMQAWPKLEWNNFTMWIGDSIAISNASLLGIWRQGPMSRATYSVPTQVVNMSTSTMIRSDGPYDIKGNFIHSLINSNTGYEDRNTYPTEVFGLGGLASWSYDKLGNYTG